VDTIVALIAATDKNVFTGQEVEVNVYCLHAYDEAMFSGSFRNHWTIVVMSNRL
jgi:hypothetical protein